MSLQAPVPRIPHLLSLEEPRRFSMNQQIELKIKKAPEEYMNPPGASGMGNFSQLLRVIFLSGCFGVGLFDYLA